MTALADSPAALRAGRRLLAHDRRIRGAFESLGLGITYDDAEAYLLGAPTFREVPENLRGQVIGMVLAFGMICVERDRELPSRLVVPG